jgi:Ca2+-binding RTX toxin-like protein
VIVGGAGVDTMRGGWGNDTFVFASEHLDGADTVLDFRIGQDVIDLSGTGLTFDDLEINADRRTITIDADGHEITLLNVRNASTFGEDDFVF